jgi:hypothetical protein
LCSKYAQSFAITRPLNSPNYSADGRDEFFTACCVNAKVKTKDQTVAIAAGKGEVKQTNIPGRLVELQKSCSRCHASNGAILT